ncbi:MAG TPA: hypothetical protein VFZ23_02275 [Pyrinomonadaceae bacterium]
MAAVTTYLRDVLIRRVLAVIAAIFLIPADRACTTVMTAPVIIIRHTYSP